MPNPPLFVRPTSVFISGTNRSFLNWVAYSLALNSGPFFRWTDVRIRGELFDPTDVLARGLIPSDQLSFRYPEELRPTPGTDAPSDSVRARPAAGTAASGEMAALLRLPQSTRETMASLPAQGRPVPLVLSNAHRIVALYPGPGIGPIVRAIVAAGAILIVTFADAPPDGRRAFETVLHLEGGSVAAWTTARLSVEQAPPDGIFRADTELPLAEIPAVADVLRPVFGPTLPS